MRQVLFQGRIGWVLGLALMWGCARESEPSGVRFAVDMTAPIQAGWFDPASETVGVRGDLSPLSWGETLAATDADGDGTYEVVVSFDDAQEASVVFKFKVDGRDDPNDGWQQGRNRTIDLTSSVRFVAAFDEPPPPAPTTFSGMIAVHEDQVAPGSDLKPRDVFVYLPAGYPDSSRRYPVLYMHDGRNVFDASEVGAEWEMDEHAQALIASGDVEPFLIVAVGNTADRTFEYTPTADADGVSGSPTTGGGDSYGRFLVDYLKPFIDATYRTLPDPANTAMGGSSLGGLITLYLGLEYPNIFGNLLVVSPSVWWDDKHILKRVEQLDQPTGQRIWLDVGGREDAGMVEDVRSLRDALTASGWTSDRLMYVEAEDANHSEGAWAARADDMLRFLYGPGARK